MKWMEKGRKKGKLKPSKVLKELVNFENPHDLHEVNNLDCIADDLVKKRQR